MIDKELILVGGGGHCKSVINVAEKAGYNICGILDRPELLGTKVLNYQVIGNDDDIPDFTEKARFLITVGHIKNPSLRIFLYDLVDRAGGQFLTLLAPSANISNYTRIGSGTVIMQNVVINANVNIGKGCIINTCANIEHDVEIGDFCHVSTGSMINGGVRIGKNSFIGSNSTIVNNIEIGDNIVVGAGSTVCKSILEAGIYVGSPAVRCDF